MDRRIAESIKIILCKKFIATRNTKLFRLKQNFLGWIQGLEYILDWIYPKLLFSVKISLILLFTYLALFPLWPQAEYLIMQQLVNDNTKDVREIDLNNINNIEIQNDDSVLPMVEDHKLIIPKIGVNTEINENLSEDGLEEGVWRKPESSTPDQGGNTVLTAHRFMYTSGPRTFYHLDKMKVEDKFSINWDGQKYEYEVVKIEVVEDDEMRIEGDSDESIVTLYTCTPLWTSGRRLVVIGKLI